MAGEPRFSIEIQQGRERSLLRRHPWIFANSISSVQGNPQPGDTVEVFDHEGRWLARAAFSPSSQIRARVWTWDPHTAIDSTFFLDAINQSITDRQGLSERQSCSAYREVYAESDGIPGLIVDRYNEVRVVQFLTVGVERWRNLIVQVLSERGDCSAIFERSDVSVRKLEGLEPRTGLLWGELPHLPFEIIENRLRFEVDIVSGHKTGFYLDQRKNRQIFQSHIKPSASVLDCFCYTGAFSILALQAGANEVRSIDSSDEALALAERNILLNRGTLENWEPVADDVFRALRKLRDRDRHFDVIVLDPPKFAATPAHVQRASRGYKDINLLAFKLLRPGGTLFTFSCSGGVSVELFQKIVADSALDAGKQASVIQSLGQPGDHPVALNFPESRYLKGLICRVEGRS
jgi:23S rRNA (cytosine1962-C5)-methyltransferase